MQDVSVGAVAGRVPVVEIRARWGKEFDILPESHRLGVSLWDRSRLICFLETLQPVLPEHLQALFDPLRERVELVQADPTAVDVFCRPGVTDAEGEMVSLALALAGCPGVTCRSGTRYRFDVSVPTEMRPAIERLVGNPLIHQFHWAADPSPPAPLPQGARGAFTGTSVAEMNVPGPDVSLFTKALPYQTPPRPLRERGQGGEGRRSVPLQNLDGEALLSLSVRHHLALDLVEMRAIAGHFKRLGREPTDVELQSFALTWSEHCSHKTFKATINFDRDGQRETIAGLLRECIVAPSEALGRSWVRSSFADNAGVIAFDGRHDLAVKVETHNHPSALEPFGGAHTGVGGVIRDVLAVSAEPIANTDVLCFGPLDLPDEALPSGVFHPRTTCREVVRGVADYGNNMGIPTVGGAVLFHPGYTANPLVFCGTLGIVPRGSHPHSPQPGDAVVLLGGRTGRDGLHGATMSSESLVRGQVAGTAVQIGAPITEKTLRDVLPGLRDERLYHAITDCGAGGLCSAVGEMGDELGVEVDLTSVLLKYQGLAPWEIWLSEAQERMVLAVPPDSLPRLRDLCRRHDVEAMVLGRFRDDGRLLLTYGEQTVADLRMDFLHGGCPQRVLQARFRSPLPQAYRTGDSSDTADNAGWLLRLLAHPNIACKREIIRRYDHEVGAGTLVRPLVGHDGPADAAVLRPLLSSRSGTVNTGWRGVVVAHGINPLYGALDPHAMALLTVDEALRNLVAAGGSIDRAALLDNFCWGDVDDPEVLGTLVRAAQGCRDAAGIYRVPFISGKDSLRNCTHDASGRHSIPGTLLISAVGTIPDARRAVTMDLKRAGNSLYLLGITGAEFGGSHYLEVRGIEGGQVPRVRTGETPHLMRRLTRAIRRGLVTSCHDLSEGGLAVAAAEMAIAGRLGLEIELAAAAWPGPSYPGEALLFAESPGRFLVEVAEERASTFERLMGGVPCARLGTVCSAPRLDIQFGGASLIDLPVSLLESRWKGVRYGHA